MSLYFIFSDLYMVLNFKAFKKYISEMATSGFMTKLSEALYLKKPFFLKSQIDTLILKVIFRKVLIIFSHISFFILLIYLILTCNNN